MTTLTKPETKTATCSNEQNGCRSVTPRVDIVESTDRYTLRADLPGVDRTGLVVSLDGNELTFVGRRQTAPAEGFVLYRETVDGEYRRSFVLDPAIDTTRIAARMDQGVLTLELPKTPAVQPRKITVTE